MTFFIIFSICDSNNTLTCKLYPLSGVYTDISKYDTVFWNPIVKSRTGTGLGYVVNGIRVVYQQYVVLMNNFVDSIDTDTRYSYYQRLKV